MTDPSLASRKIALSRRRVALIAAAVAVGMLGLSYLAVPLYQIFCRATGFAGTPRVADSAAPAKGKRVLVVRFDTNVAPGLPWSFEPETPSIKLATGETATVFFKVVNQSARATAAFASYNVTPDVAGGYFDKISCFCFNEQRLDPGQTMDMPVVFFLDPALEKDETMANVEALTLSYTFFAAKDQTSPIANAKPRPASKL
ncbi:MAG: cytochrome c oxidase assembly protein [Methylobacteriaceae bacterium]|nr:cytochrome c oxidase assembly protein [Methylobacteriaceae bacterium]